MYKKGDYEKLKSKKIINFFEKIII